MTPTQFTHLRGVLEARQAELQDPARNRDVIAVDSSADMLDQIQHALERDMAIGNLERESVRLREVRDALRRIHLGAFGICIDCEEEISIKRLAAVPWTTLCLACRESRDRNPMLIQNSIERDLFDAV